MKPETGYEIWKDHTLRKASREVDFGCWWTLNGRPDEFPRWRVSWIELTGELYARQLSADRYIGLGLFDAREKVEAAMEGWADPESPIYHNLTALAATLP